MRVAGCRPSQRSPTSRRRRLLALVAFVAALTSGRTHAATVVGYSEPTVWQYLRQVPRSNVSADCGHALDRIETYLTDQRTLADERRWFYQSFASGDASQFVSRDQDRWIYRAFECLKAAGETSYSASQYPLHYCYGFNDARRETAYGVCM